MKKWTTLLIALLGLALAGCTHIQVHKISMVPAGTQKTFDAKFPAGAMMGVTVNPKDIQWPDKEAEANAMLKFPSLADLPSVDGWLLLNLEPY